MAFDYTGVATLADQMIAEFGQSITLTSKTPGTYNLATGAATLASSNQTVTGAVFDHPSRNIDGTMIRQGDKQLYITPLATTAPHVNDTVTIGGTVYTVTMVKPVSPAGTVVLYECNIRGAV